MGRQYIQDVLDQGVDIDNALRIHFQGNHYPPLPLSLISVAKKAIEHANKGEWDKELELPHPVTYRDRKTAPVNECVEAWHLDCFLDLDENDL